MKQTVKSILGDIEIEVPTVQHTPRCIAAAEEARRLIDQYTAQWPNYCRTCQGLGYTEYQYDPSPAGVGLSPGYMIDTEPCPDCTCKGVCPRCGGTNMDETAEVCFDCKWFYDDPDPHPCPMEHECYCGYFEPCD